MAAKIGDNWDCVDSINHTGTIKHHIICDFLKEKYVYATRVYILFFVPDVMEGLKCPYLGLLVNIKCQIPYRTLKIC